MSAARNIQSVAQHQPRQAQLHHGRRHASSHRGHDRWRRRTVAAWDVL